VKRRLPAGLSLARKPFRQSLEFRAMSNPWLKKNPWLSMWLSGANAAAGFARGHATAQAQRQTKQLMAASQKQAVDFWSEVFSPKPAKKKKRRRK
jgi:hypothetical protein